MLQCKLNEEQMKLLLEGGFQVAKIVQDIKVEYDKGESELLLTPIIALEGYLDGMKEICEASFQ